MTLREYAQANEAEIKQWAIAAFRYLPTQKTIDSINAESWVATFPALRKEAEEWGVTEIPEADEYLFRYIMSLQPRKEVC